MEKVELYVDAECLLCAASVKFLNKGIKPEYFVEVFGIQSAEIELPEEVKSLSSVGMHYKNDWFTEWRVVKQALKMKPGFLYRFLHLIALIIPNFMGNAGYRFIAKRRLKWSERYMSDTCLMPSSFYPTNKKSRVALNNTAFRASIVGAQD